MKYLIAFVLFLGLFSSCKPVEIQEVKQFNVDIELNGSKQVPANNSTGKGTLKGRYDRGTKVFSYTLSYTGMTAIGWNFHSRTAIRDVNNMITGYQTTGSPVMEITNTTPVPSFTGQTTPLTADQEADLIAGRWYINIRGLAFTAGEIRGDIVFL